MVRTDIRELLARHAGLARRYELTGAHTLPRKVSEVSRRLEAEARAWLIDAERHLQNGPAADVPLLIDAYDLMHRVAMRRRPAEVCDAVRRAALSKWKAGDKSIGLTGLVLTLWPMVRDDFAGADPRVRDFCLSVIDSWIAELRIYGKFRAIPAAEAYRRLTLLLKEDLGPYLTADKTPGDTKRRWVAAYQLRDPALLDPDTLLAYRPFILTATTLGLIPTTPGLIPTTPGLIPTL